MYDVSGGPPSDPPPTTRHAATSARRKWPTPTLVVAAVIGLLVGGVAGWFIRGGGDSGETDTALETTTTAGDGATTTTAAAPTEAGASEDDPIALRGTGAVGAWTAAVVQTTPDASAELATLAAIPPPPEGAVYFMVAVEITNQGGAPAAAGELSPALIDAGGTAYEPNGAGCGAIPDPLSGLGTVEPGASAQGNVCVLAPALVVPTMVLSLSTPPPDGETTWFALF